MTKGLYSFQRLIFASSVRRGAARGRRAAAPRGPRRQRRTLRQRAGEGRRRGAEKAIFFVRACGRQSISAEMDENVEKQAYVFCVLHRIMLFRG